MAKRGEKLEGKKLEQIHEAAKKSWSEESRAKRKANLALNRMLGTTTGERRQRLTPEVQEHIREAMLEMNEETKHPFYMDFIDNFLTEAKTNPNSQAGQRLAGIIFGQDMLQALDEEINKQMKRDQGFAEYQIRKTLYDKQQEVFDNRQDNFIVMICTRRAGKCFGKGTKFRKYDGSIVNVEDIKVGDILRDDQNRPTEVISLTRGRDKMYRISANVENARMSHVVNSAHIITVKRTSKDWCSYKQNEVYDIPLQEFINFPKYEQEHFSLYRLRADYAEVDHAIDPYLLGLWLGDGNKNDFQICVNSDDTEIRDYLRNLNLLKNKHIPKEYLIDSVENRLKLLAGLIDSDGYNYRNSSIEISSSNKQLADDIFELCCSLGFRVLIRNKQAKLYGIPKKISYTITIKGQLDDIPNVLTRKHAFNSKQREIYGFHIEELAEDYYYGFTLNGNGRCILEDYTVTHNTELDARLLARAVLEPNTPCLYINRTFDNAVNQLGRPLCNVLDELKMTYSGRPGGGILHFPNGSSITFGGFANKGQIDVYRGGKYKVVIIDEIGHLRNADMLLKEVIEPAMIDFGKQKQLILTGTPPRTKASYAYQIWHSDGVKKYHWSFMDNPFIPDKETVIDEACKRHGVNEEAPFIQREYYGNMEAFDTDALIFKGYTTYDKLPQGRTWSHAWVGVDWGFEDKAAVVSMVADRAKKEMYIVNVWSEAKRGTSEQCEIVKQFVDELNQLPHSWGNVQVVCDTNDKQGSYDLYHQYHISNVTNAYKYDRDMSIEQLAEWLRTGTIKVPKKDNELTNDLEYSIWERDDETDELKHELSDEYHPNAAMALLYASRQFAYYVLGLVETNKPAKHIANGLYPEETVGGTDD